MKHPDVKGMLFSVLGGARSGLAAARLLKEHGARVFLSDRAPISAMKEAIEKLEQIGVEYEFGEHSRRLLHAEVLVVSPGVPSDARVVQEAHAAGVKTVGEVEMASWFCPGPIVAVTGTNGKTTTTALLGRMFADAQRKHVVGGNIGTAFSEIVTGVDTDTTVILEVSSFQLDMIETFRPTVSVLLNITPDHLDRYEHSFEKYVASKGRVFMNQRLGDSLVYNNDDKATRTLVENRAHQDVRRLPFSLQRNLPEGAWVESDILTTKTARSFVPVIGTKEISIRGRHNLYNAMAATLAAETMEVSRASLRNTLRNFKGVEHRLEFVREIDGVQFVNDSKATNVDSVWYALQSFKSPIVLLLGGRDKGNDYSVLMEPVRKNVKGIVAIGESAEKVVAAFSPVVTVVRASSMQDAIVAGRGMARSGDVVLLSPACASFDWFENYEHRGRVFKEIVGSL